MNIDDFNILTKIRKWKSGKVRYRDMCRRLGWSKDRLVATLEAHNLFKARNHAWWNEERIQTLRDMAAKECFARDIAKELNTSKNSIIGKARRLGVQLRTPPGSTRPDKGGGRNRSKDTPTRQNPFRISTFRGPEAVELQKEPPSENWQELRYVTGCRWPTLGEPGPEMMCCGAKQIEGQSYCEYHYWKAYRVPQSGRATDSTIVFHTPAVVLDTDAA